MYHNVIKVDVATSAPIISSQASAASTHVRVHFSASALKLGPDIYLLCFVAAGLRDKLCRHWEAPWD